MDIVVLNIGGTIFEISRKLLNKYPETRLGQLNASCENFVKERNLYFYDRNPEIFNVILDFYRNDEVHLPSYVCAKILKKELKFWKIGQKIETCCIQSYLKFENNVKLLEKIKTPKIICYDENDASSRIQRISRYIWMSMEFPISSRAAKINMVIYFLVIMLSTVVIFLSSHSSFREERIMFDGNITMVTNLQDYLREQHTNEKVIKHVMTKPYSALTMIERITDSFFLIEMVIHFAVCPNKLTFFKNLRNITDLIINIGIVTKWILDEYYNDVYHSYILYVLYACCHAIVVFRLTRIFRVALQLSGIRILFLALKESMKDLIILLLMCITIAILFSNMIYYAEFPNFTFANMFEGLWFSLVTMTTVGYGDIVPKTSLGCLVGSICALFGILSLAMPIAVVSGNFTTYYKKHTEYEMIKRLQSERNETEVDKIKTKDSEPT